MTVKGNKAPFSKCLLCLSNPRCSLLTCRHSFCLSCVESVQEFQEIEKCDICCPLCESSFQLIKDNYVIPGKAGVRILSLDGGGVRGIIEVRILQHILRRFPEGTKVSQLFDFIIGSSTGGMVAVSIGLHRRTLEELVELYNTFPRQIFKKSFVINNSFLRTCYLLIGGKHLYNVANLEQQMKLAVQTEKDFIDTMSDESLPKVAIVAANYTSGTVSTEIFANYLPPSPMEAKDSKDIPTEVVRINNEVKLYQALTASAAAPVYFGPYRIDDDFFVDGGVLHNNPLELALEEVHSLWPDKNLDYIVSLGTGRPPKSSFSDSFLSWANALATQATDPELVHQRSKALFRRLRAVENEPRKKYFRLDPTDISVELDDPSSKAMDVLIGQADAFLNTERMQRKLDSLCDMIVAKGFYIDSSIMVKSHGQEHVMFSFYIKSRLPVEMGKAFTIDFVEEVNSPPVIKTYEERVDQTSRKISFVTKRGAQYTCTVRIVIRANETGIDISGSPIQIDVPFDEYVDEVGSPRNNPAINRTRSKKNFLSIGRRSARPRHSADGSLSPLHPTRQVSRKLS